MGHNIYKAARMRRNLTQTKLAGKINTNRNYLSQIESGKKIPDWTVVAAMAEALDCPELCDQHCYQVCLKRYVHRAFAPVDIPEWNNISSRINNTMELISGVEEGSVTFQFPPITDITQNGRIEEQEWDKFVLILDQLADISGNIKALLKTKLPNTGEPIVDTDLSEKLTKKYRRKPENQNALTAEREALGLTRADVAALVHMDRATYTNIENAHDNDFEVPSPERFLELSRKLNAPEILDYYCYWHCPCETVPLLENESLDSVMSILLTQLLKMNNINNTLYNIIGDGYIAPNERQALKEILTILAGIAYSADSMKLLIVSQLVDSLQILFADGMVSEQERVKLGKILDMLEDLEFDPEYVNMLRARYLANGEDANVF